MNLESDLLSTVLRSMQVSASLLLVERYTSPWRVELPDSQQLAALFGLSPDTHVIAFHLVREGELNVAVGDSPGSTTIARATVRNVHRGDGRRTRPNHSVRRVRGAEVAILFGGDSHVLWAGDGAQAVSLESLLAGVHPGGGDSRSAADQGAEATRLVCGAFTMRHTYLNPLFAALPNLAVLSLGDNVTGHWLTSVAQQLIAELEAPNPGSAFVIERLLELFCAAAVRDYMESRESPHEGWFGALQDDAVLKALNAIHNDPAFPWTVQSLAVQASLSRSRLSERFAQAVGDPPMLYLAKWRMNTATRLLSGTRHPVQRVANEVGYESLAAFSRAFKQHLGVSPAKFRAQTPHID